MTVQELPDEMKQRMLESGVVVDEAKGRSGTFVQVDHSPDTRVACAERRRADGGPIGISEVRLAV